MRGRHNLETNFKRLVSRGLNPKLFLFLHDNARHLDYDANPVDFNID